MKKYIKNISNNTFNVAGFSVEASEMKELIYLKQIKYINSGDESVESLINSDQALLSLDGVSTLSKEASIIIASTIGNAKEVFFENNDLLNNNFISENVQDAIVEARNTASGAQFIQYQLIGQANYDQYLFSGSHKYKNSKYRSGSESNGYRYTSCAPQSCNISGKVINATANITGIAQTTGEPAPTVKLQFELWKVGFSNEGEKLGDIFFNINSSNYNIGLWWDSSILTGFSETQGQDINVSLGDMLALKFIRNKGNDVVVSVHNPTITLTISGE